MDGGRVTVPPVLSRLSGLLGARGVWMGRKCNSPVRAERAVCWEGKCRWAVRAVRDEGFLYREGAYQPYQSYQG